MTDKAALIIDEDKSHCKGLALAVKEIFLEISFANNPFAAIEILKNKQDSIIFTEIKFSAMEGIDLIKNIFNIAPECQIIICSGYLDNTNKNKLKQIGVQHFFEKPLQIDVLKRTVMQLI